LDLKNLSSAGFSSGKALLVFDLDGTLLDTMHDIQAAVNVALSKQGKQALPLEAVTQMVGNGVSVLARKALAGTGDEAAFLQDYHAYYRAHLYDKTVPYPGIPALIDRLSKQGYKLAVLSNKPQAETERLIEAFFPQGLFAMVWGQTEERPKKPDPKAPLALAKLLSFSPESCVMIGDSDVDMQTAKAAGFFPLGVTWGYQSKETLQTAGAKILVNSENELANVLIFS
jgi:phosphoglycolate phosphatase